MMHPNIDQQAADRPAHEHPCDHQLADEHVAAIKSFIDEVGGIENARQALLALAECQKAA